MSSREEQVIQGEKLWLQTHLDLDIDELDKLMHQDYQSVRPDGTIWDKSRALKSYREDGRMWDLAEVSELDIRVYSSSALVIGIWKAKGENRCEQFDYRARYLSVWIEDSQGEWKLVHDQSIPITDKFHA